MNQPYNNPQQPLPHTQNYNAAYNPEPTINFPTSPVFDPNNASEQQWKHYLTNIRPSITSKLTFIGVFYILIGILSVALELHLVFNEDTSYYAAFINGVLLFIVGILTLILCRQQVFVLTSLFVLVIFQLVMTMITFSLYCYVLIGISDDTSDCSIFSSNSCNREVRILRILIADLFHLFTTFCIIIVNLVIIKNARRPPITPATASYSIYTPHAQSIPVSFQNPPVLAINQSD